MATRKVTVELELEVSRYMRGAAEASAVTKGVKVSIKELGDEADDTSRDMDQLAANTDIAKRAVDDLGDEALGTTRDLAILDAKIRETELSVRRLGVAFARGDESAAGDLDKERSMLGQLKRLRKELDDLTPGGGGGFRFLKNIDFSNTVAEARGQLITALIGAVIVTSPAIGALIAGAVAGTVAGGGIIGGVIAAANDPRVKTEWSRLVSLMNKEAFGSNAFVAPVIDALETLQGTFQDIHLGDTLAKGAAGVDELTSGIDRLVRNAMPGFDRMMGSSESIMRVFGDGLAEIGDGFSDLFDDIRRSRGTLQGLQLLLEGIAGTIRVTGQLLNWLGNRWHDLVSFFADSSGALEDVAAWVTKIGSLGTRDSSFASEYLANWNDTFERWEKTGTIVENTGHTITSASVSAAGGVRSLGEAAVTAADQLDKLEHEMDQLIPAAFDLEAAQDDAANAIADLNEQLKEQRDEGVEGAGALKGNTQAARDNREAVRDLVDQYGGLIVKAGGTREAAAELKDELRKQLIQMGFNSTEVQYYVDQLDRIPVDKITQLKVENEQAILAAQETERELNRLYDRTIYVKLYHDTIYTEYRAGERSDTGRPPGIDDSYRNEGRYRAAGGPVWEGSWIVGDGGRPEVLTLGPGQTGYVYPSMQSWQAAMPAAGAIDYARLGAEVAAALRAQPVENHIEIGGEVVRVVQATIAASNRNTRRLVQAGATR